MPVKHVFRQFSDFRQISLYSVLAKIFQNFFSLRPFIREDIGVHILRSGCWGGLHIGFTAQLRFAQVSPCACQHTDGDKFDNKLNEYGDKFDNKSELNSGCKVQLPSLDHSTLVLRLRGGVSDDTPVRRTRNKVYSSQGPAQPPLVEESPRSAFIRGIKLQRGPYAWQTKVHKTYYNLYSDYSQKNKIKQFVIFYC